MPEGKPTPNYKLRFERERRAWSQQKVADLVGTTPLNDVTQPIQRAIRQPDFLIPRLRGYPRWFAVLATSGAGRPLMLVFDQDHHGAPWLAAARASRLTAEVITEP